MKTIDQCIAILVNELTIHDILPSDLKSLRGLQTTIDNRVFLTHGQSEFCLKLLESITHIIEPIIPEIELLLQNPTWSKPFRVIAVIKRMTIEPCAPYFITKSCNHIKIESNYSTTFRSLMNKLQKTGVIISTLSGTVFYAHLTEKNIVELVDLLSLRGFEISDEILQHYQLITSWKIGDIIDQYALPNIQDVTVRRLIMNDIGADTPLDSLLVDDRRLRYQYHLDDAARWQNIPTTMTEVIARRPTTTLWIDSAANSLSSVISSLRELRRFPILFTIDSRNSDEATNCLQLLSDALDENNITDNIGVYIRLENPTGKKFNDIIHEKCYNNRLDTYLSVAVVGLTLLPKFFLNTDWQPMAVISLDHTLRNSKTAIYTNQCDLVISYSLTESMINIKR